MGEHLEGWVLWEKVSHTLFELGNLGQLAVFGLKIVEEEVERLHPCDALWLLCKLTYSLLKDCSCI
jgi:hypothetical protein